MHWLTTAPNPRSSGLGYDCGQRGWKLHAVDTTSDSFKEIGQTRAVCGLRPAHGWDLDYYIQDRCERCARALARRDEGQNVGQPRPTSQPTTAEAA